GEEAVAGMDRLAAGRLRRCDDVRDPQVALRRGRRPDPNSVVGLAHVQRVGVGGRVDRDRLAPELVQRANHPHRDLAPVRDEDPVEHQSTAGTAIGSSSKRSWPYSTGSALPTWIARTTASTSAFTSFISFIASRMQRVCPGATASPSSTNGAEPGAGAR